MPDVPDLFAGVGTPGAPSPAPATPASGTPDVFAGVASPKKAAAPVNDNPMTGATGTIHPLTATQTARAPSPFGILGGRIDAPFILGNASFRGDTPAQRQQSTKDAFKLWLTDPEAADRKYGLMAPEQLQVEAKQNKARGDTSAIGQLPSFFLRHPKTSGVVAGVGEALNPVGFIGGEGIARGAAAFANEVPGVAKAGSFIAEALGDRFASLRRTIGPEAELGMRDVLGAKGRAAIEAQDATRNIFAGQTINQKKHIVRVYQGTEQAATPEISARAKQLGAFVQKIDLHQLEYPDLLATDRQFKAAPYFPMKNAFESPTDLDPATQALLEKIDKNKPFAGSFGRAEIKGTAGASGNYRRKYATLADAEATGRVAEDFDPAKALQSHAAQRLTNVHSEDAFNALPSSVRNEITYQTRGGKAFAPVDETGKPLTRQALLDAVDYENLRVLREAKGKPLPYYQKPLVDLPNVTANDAAFRPSLADAPDWRARAGAPVDTPGQMGLHIGQYADARLPERGAVQPGLFTRSGVDPGTHASYRAAQAVPASTRLDPLTGDVTAFRDALAAQHAAIRMAAVAPKAATASQRLEVGSLFAPKATGGGPLYGKPLEKAIAKLDKDKNAAILRENPNAIVAAPPAEGFVPAALANRSINSATLTKYSTLHHQFADVLNKVMGAPPPAQSEGVMSMFDTFNKLTRIGVISNPIVHPGWNLTLNYLAAGGNWKTVGRIWAQTAKAIGQGVTGRTIQEAQPLETIAGRAAEGSPGATSMLLGGERFGGDDPVRVMTSPDSELTPAERINKRLTSAWEGNQKITFGVADREFAKETLKLFKARGMSDAEAAIATRKAYGDAMSMHPDSWLSKAAFFAPWLKAVIPFWLKTSVTNPNAINAPYQGIRRQNELLGDPLEDDPNNPTGDFTIALGPDNKGGMRYFAAPHPARTALDLATGAYDVFGRHDLQGGLYAGQRVLASHFNPLYSAGLNTATTLAAPPKDPDLPQNYRTVFNRAAPGDVQVRQGAQYVGRAMLGPLPFSQQLQGIPSWIRSAQNTPAGIPTAESLLGVTGGSYYARDPADTKAGLGKVGSKIFKEIQRIQYSNLPDVQKQALIQTLYGAYTQVRDSMGVQKR